MENSQNKRQADRLYSIKPTRIHLMGKAYRLKDISEGGLGIIVDGPYTFFIGQRIDSIPLQLNDEAVYLKGTVTHISKTQLHYICGIRFIFSGIEEYESLARFKKERTLAD
jgi:hypothetical protein